MFDPTAFRQAVRQTARSVSSKFPSYVDAEDTEQGLWLWLYAQRNWILEAVKEDGIDQVEARIIPLMRKAAFELCNKEKAQTEGYHTSDVYRYSTQKIARLLPDIFEYEGWQSFGDRGDGQPKAKSQANMTGDRVVELIDIKYEFENLKQESQQILTFQYLHNMTMEEIAEQFDVSVEAAKKRAQRALGALQRGLGYKDPDELARRQERRMVKPNSAWRAGQEL